MLSRGSFSSGPHFAPFLTWVALAAQTTTAMAAASISTEGFGQGLAHHQKLTKSRNRTVVKPILKKLHSAASDDTSLDLDRGWDEQPIHYYIPC